MGLVLAVATILGGIAAVWFFWEKMARHGQQQPAPFSSKPEIVYVDQNYPEDSGLGPKLRAEGKRLYWSREDELQRRLDLQGWNLVVESRADGRRRTFRIRDPHGDLFLIEKVEVS